MLLRHSVVFKYGGVNRRTYCMKAKWNGRMFATTTGGGGGGGGNNMKGEGYRSEQEKMFKDEEQSANSFQDGPDQFQFFENEKEQDQFMNNFRKIQEDMLRDKDMERKRVEVENFYRKEMGMPLQDPLNPVRTVPDPNNPFEIDTPDDKASVRCFVFPGQGSQCLGMGKDLVEDWPSASHVFDALDDVLKEKFSRMMWNGPKEELRKTENAQPAILATSYAMWITMMNELKIGGDTLPMVCDVLAGHSLGLYTALCCAGAFSLDEAIMLTRLRGLAMRDAMIEYGRPGGMVALMGCSPPVAYLLAAHAQKATGFVCEVTSINTKKQVVIGGDMEAVYHAVKLGKSGVTVIKGKPPVRIRRAVLLDVSAPFHCSLMQPAADQFMHHVKALNVQEPLIPVVSDVDGELLKDPVMIKTAMVEQFTTCVDWTRVVDRCVEMNVNTFIELGATQVVTPLTRRCIIDKLPSEKVAKTASAKKAKRLSRRQALSALMNGEQTDYVPKPRKRRNRVLPSSQQQAQQQQQQQQQQQHQKSGKEKTIANPVPDPTLPVKDVKYREDVTAEHVGGRKSLLDLLNFMAVDMQNSFVSRFPDKFVDPEPAGENDQPSPPQRSS